MPNWEITKIVITGKRDVLERIDEAITLSNEPPETLDDGSNNNWVGNILARLHINARRYKKRAFWTHSDFDKHGHLVVEEYSAWERSDYGTILQQHFAHEISGISFYDMTNL